MYRKILIGADQLDQTADALALALRLHAPASLDPMLVSTRRHGSDPDLLCALAGEHEADLIVLAARTGAALRLAHTAPCAVAVAPAGLATHPNGGPVFVAYDGSSEADVALAVAYDLASAKAIRVVLCDVLEPAARITRFARAVRGPAFPLDARHAAERSLAAAARRAPAGVEVETRILRGLPGRAILEAAGPQTGLILAGSRHLGPVDRVFAGSVSGCLLANGHAPVLVTPRIEPAVLAGFNQEDSTPLPLAALL